MTNNKPCTLLYVLGSFLNITSYRCLVLQYDNTEQTVNIDACPTTELSFAEISKMLTESRAVICNAIVGTEDKLRPIDITQENIIQTTADSVRKYMEINYGVDTDLCGHCIEASELIVAILGLYDIKARTVEGWCRYDDDYYGSDVPYDPHTWVEVDGGDGKIYIDVAADQFNNGMWDGNEYPAVLVSRYLPHGMSYKKPDCDSFDTPTETPIRMLIYELYKADWEKYHITPSQKISAMLDWFDENQDEYFADKSQMSTFDAFIANRGYNSMIYACFDEFMTAEYQDGFYVKKLLLPTGRVDELMALYRKDIKSLNN